MKSTPTRGVKESLKPNAYKQSEPSRLLPGLAGRSGRGDGVPFV